MKWLKQKRRKKAWKGERGQKVFKGKNTENQAKKQENIENGLFKKKKSAEELRQCKKITISNII